MCANSFYWIVDVSGSGFKLALTKGGSAIDLAGTQGSLGTNADIMRVCKSMFVYDLLSINFNEPIIGEAGKDLIITLNAVTDVQGLLNATGFTERV